jgi:DNA-binding NarL/FixJ family response regulator
MAAAPSLTILTVDDHPLIRAGLGAVLASEPDLSLIAEACSMVTTNLAGYRGMK